MAVMSEKKHILITGGAGYIGSLLTAELLRAGIYVTVVDNLLYGGESLLGFFAHPDFHFARGDVSEPGSIRPALDRRWPKPDAVVHLAGIVGFPACQAIGKQAAWRYNVEAVRRVFEQVSELGTARFVFTSTYSNYGASVDGKAATEDALLTPQSLYAETKIAAEEYLLAQKESPTATLIFRLTTLYGISPRTRFDLLVNQFVLDAYTRRELIIYQRGYSRSFIHVRDAVRGIISGLNAPETEARGQVYNLGTENGNYTKDEIVGLVIKRLPETVVTYKDLTFGGDIRDIAISFEKIRCALGFSAEMTVDDGVREVVHALRTGIIRNPQDEKYTNARFIVH
jgi:nucleoside-diphosphate-sugar epimerase